MILYCQFDIKGGALRMLQIPRNSLVATQNRKITLSNGKTYAATNYQINSVALSNGGDIAALAEVIYDPVSYTHLDVYKRQGPHCCRQPRGDGPGDGPSGRAESGR